MSKLGTSLERGHVKFDPILARGAVEELIFMRSALPQIAQRLSLEVPGELFFVRPEEVLQEIEGKPDGIGATTARHLVEQEGAIWQWMNDIEPITGPNTYALHDAFERAMRAWQQQATDNGKS